MLINDTISSISHKQFCKWWKYLSLLSHVHMCPYTHTHTHTPHTHIHTHTHTNTCTTHSVMPFCHRMYLHTSLHTQTHTLDEWWHICVKQYCKVVRMIFKALNTISPLTLTWNLLYIYHIHLSTLTYNYITLIHNTCMVSNAYILCNVMVHFLDVANMETNSIMSMALSSCNITTQC